MAILNFADILQKVGIDPKRVKVIRHSLTSDQFKPCYKKGMIWEYTRTQSRNFAKDFDYWAVFIGDEGTMARFYALYKVDGFVPATPEVMPVGFPHVDWFTGENGYFNLEHVDLLQEYEDRLIIDWGRGTLAWHQSGSLEKPIVAIQSRAAEVFSGYENLILSFDQLNTIIKNRPVYESWHTALEAVKAVYLIVDTVSGQQYVGSAYGNDGLLGRWKAYIDTRDGGNKKIKELLCKAPERYHKFGFVVELMKTFDEIFIDCTKYGVKIKTSEYCEQGKNIIVDQGQAKIAGYTDNSEGLFTDVPVIIFGDHTRTIKYIDTPFFLGADGTKVLKSKLEDANYKYLYYALKNTKIPNTGYSRHFKWLKNAKIRYPNIQKQEKIVAMLSKIERIIENYQTKLTKLDELVKARFVEMFGDPVLNPHGFKKVALSELAEIKIGPFGSLLHKEDYIEGGHPLLNPSHIIDGKVVPDSKLTISDAKYAELDAYHLRTGDVVMGRRGEMGRCAVVSCEGLLCGTGSLLIRTKGEVTADYIQKTISFPSFKKTIEDMAVGQTMPNLNVPIVSRFQIIKPPIEVQNNYYAFVEQVNKSKVAVQKALDEAQLLFDSLMQEYFG